MNSALLLHEDQEGLLRLTHSSDGRFTSGQDGVVSIATTGDRKLELIRFRHHTLAYVASSLGYSAYYPLHPVALVPPIRAVLMDLDGTTVRSEDFWIWIIERTVAGLRDEPGFSLEEKDLPFVSGHSVSEHLQYGIEKYCPGKTVEEARRLYFEHTHREMKAILEGKGRADAFKPAPGIREFLLKIKSSGVKIALVTSGLYEKAYPEILAAFRTMNLGDPCKFYDAIITAGFPLREGSPGTLGELSPKPHPWLYAEASRIGLGIPFEQRSSVIGIEDSAAGICSIRLSGFAAIGVSGGNITASGAESLCSRYYDTITEALELFDRTGN